MEFQSSVIKTSYSNGIQLKTNYILLFFIVLKNCTGVPFWILKLSNLDIVLKKQSKDQLLFKKRQFKSIKVYLDNIPIYCEQVN